MKILPVSDPSFREFGRVVSGLDTEELLAALRDRTPLPEGVDYVPDDEVLSKTETAEAIAPYLFGGLPVEFGWCNGHNTRLTCLEYHRNSEFNLGAEPFILLLARQQDIHEDKLDTSVIRAFYVPAGVLVEVYATALHYAPCHADPDRGFKVMVALPEGTNLPCAHHTDAKGEEKLLWAVNKWLLAGPDTTEASDGACVGITGSGIDIEDMLPVQIREA